MPAIKFTNFDFNQLRMAEKCARVAQFNTDWNAFVAFVDDPANSSHQRFGAFAMAEVKRIRPEVEQEVQNRSGSAPFLIFLDQGETRCFVAVSKPPEDVVYVWPCWRSEEARRNRQLDGPACLRKLATLALGAREGVDLKFSEQENKAFMWKASAVHPLQVLENAYQRIVHKAGSQADADPIQAQSETLSRYFLQDAGDPACFDEKASPTADGGQLSAVRMNHLIETFYLFRLLVRYQAESPQEISEETRVDLSGDLTKLLHNGDRAKMGWLSAWLTKKIAELGKEVARINGAGERRVLFFLKGGRALNYFLGTPEKGENDWDTQVVIDPRLPAEEWYQAFTKVHDVLLTALRRFRVEFTGLVQANAASFSDYLLDKAGPDVPDDEEVDDYDLGDVQSRGLHASCKAELIDIGIPRRDSASALEEWMRLSSPGALLEKDGVIFPHREYYLNEYLMMVRDAFLPGADVRKAPKRITRFNLVLASGGHDAADAVEAARLKALPKTADAIGQLQRKDRRELFRVIFSQFVEGYNLLQDRELAEAFDQKSVAALTNPPPLPGPLAEKLDDAQRSLAADVGLAHALSEVMREHWQQRNAFFEQNRAFFAGFLREASQLTYESLGALDAQFAVAGSFAAQLHAGHLRMTPQGLEPIRRILVKLQCAKGRNQGDVIDAVRNVITRLAADSRKLQLVDMPVASKYRSMTLFWSEKASIGAFRYAPLVMKIRVAPQTGRQLPVLTSIDGIPVLDLRYIAADYLNKTSKIDEMGSRRTLAAAKAAVAEMLSQFDFESDRGDDAPVAVRTAGSR
jgi:hypothetical protein